MTSCSTLARSLRPLTRDDEPLLWPFYQSLHRPLADLHALMMVAWREVLNLTLAIDDGILYVVARWDGTPVLWGPPLGPNVAVRHVNRAFALLRELGAARPQVLYVWEDYALWRVLRSATHVRIVAQAFEYIYDARQLATLAGSDFRTKRKERARVARDESVAWRRYDNAFAADCVALLDQWIAQKRERVAERDLAKFETEARVCRRALTDELPLSGVVLLVDGRTEGFSLGAPHADRTFNCMFEKSNLSRAGAATALFSKLGEFCDGAYDEINAGEDWGVGYLRASKRAWKPLRTPASYIAQAL